MMNDFWIIIFIDECSLNILCSPTHSIPILVNYLKKTVHDPTWLIQDSINLKPLHSDIGQLQHQCLYLYFPSFKQTTTKSSTPTS